MNSPYHDPQISVIIVTWNQRDLTLECLAALFALDYPAEKMEVILVDNCSQDDTIGAVAHQFPQVRVIANVENIGFTGGNNVGIGAALASGADYMFLLNNDALVAKDALSQLVRAAQQEPEAGILGPKIYHREAPDRIQSAGMVSDRFWRFRQRGLDQLEQGQFDNAEEVDAVSGCAMLISRQVIETIGSLDARYFMYHEDIDWCYSTRAYGYRILYVPLAKVWHRNPQARASELARVTYYITRNTYLFFAKHKAPLRAYVLHTLQSVVWLLNWTLNPKWTHKREARDALLKALLDALYGRYGKRKHRYGT